MRARVTDSPWLLVAGGLIGLAAGIVVSLVTDVPLAPEAGIVLGVVAAWLARRRTAPSSS